MLEKSMPSCVRLLIILCLMTALVPSISAQIYHIYRPTSQTTQEKQTAPQKETATPRHWLAIEGSTLISYGSIRDRGHHSVTRSMKGWRMAAMVPVSSVIAVGAQVEKLKAHDMATDMISPITRDSWAARARITLTPSTEPQVYLLLGLGQAKYKSKFSLQKHSLNGSTPLVLLGTGIDVKIWKGMRLSAEYQLQGETNHWENFAMTGPKVRHEFAASVSYWF